MTRPGPADRPAPTGRLGPTDHLGPADRLPVRPSRVLVAGPSGSGKTTLARAIATALDLPHTEIDALFHGPGWVRRPEFEADVAAMLATGQWVTEFQYQDVRPALLAAADLVVALDLPVRVAMTRLTRRTLRRRLRREVLWNGNVEPPLRTVITDRDHILRWGWRTRHATRDRLAEIAAARPELPVVVLRSATAVAAWRADPLAAAARPR